MKAAVVCVLVCVCVSVSLAMPQGWSVGADKTRRGGTGIRAEGEKRWELPGGRTRAEVYGHWDRTYGGPNNGQRYHGVGSSFGSSWGK